MPETTSFLFIGTTIIVSIIVLILLQKWKSDKHYFNRIIEKLTEQTQRVRSADWEQISKLKKIIEILQKQNEPEKVPFIQYEGSWQDQDHKIISGEGGKGWEDPNHPIIR